MITKDNQNLPISEITPENYKVPAGEERFYHVKMEVKSFDQHTGERLSRPFVQKFAAIDFENGMMSILRQQGYSMTILHNPKEWKKEQAKILAQKKADAEKTDAGETSVGKADADAEKADAEKTDAGETSVGKADADAEKTEKKKRKKNEVSPEDLI